MHCSLERTTRGLVKFTSLPVSTFYPPLWRRPLGSSLRSTHSIPSPISNSTRTCWQPPRRAFSSTVASDSPQVDELFNYTSGCWLVNNALRHAERRRPFNISALCRLAAQSVGRHAHDVAAFAKLAEGGFNRTFLLTMHDGFKMVARVPYPATVPKFYAVASEVATMRFLRSTSSGLPVPEVYDYAPSPDNPAQTEYIFMEYVRGTKLSDVWMDLGEREIEGVLRQVVLFEARVMEMAFPAGGSLYYAHDLEKVGRTGVSLGGDEGFCVGPDARLCMWYGRRSLLDVDRGPYKTAEAALTAPAHKEIAYLEQFGKPLLPFQRERREAYGYEAQSPSEHVANLDRYLLLAPSLVPAIDPTLRTFRMRHPDLQPSNVIVSLPSASESGENSLNNQREIRVVGLLDWQHTAILPQFLQGGVPGRLENYDDPVSQALVPPSEFLPPSPPAPALPANLDDAERDPSTESEQEQDDEQEDEQEDARGLYHRRLVHYHYVKHTEMYNPLHHAALSDPLSMFVHRLYEYAGAPWEGDPHALKAALIEATSLWGRLTSNMGADATPCPIAFSPSDIHRTHQLTTKLRLADANFEGCRGMIGFESETWVSNEHFKMAGMLAELLKLRVLMGLPKGEGRERAERNWFLDDMDEGEYM